MCVCAWNCTALDIVAVLCNSLGNFCITLIKLHRFLMSLARGRQVTKHSSKLAFAGVFKL